MRLSDHLKESLKLEAKPSPWPRMWLAGLSVGLPLLIGWWRAELHQAIFGSLFGFIMILNDHFGPFLRRVRHLLTAGTFILSGLFIGVLLQGQIELFLVVLFTLSILLGKAKGHGVELERMLLFTILQILAAAQNPHLVGNLLVPVKYGIISGGNYLVCLGVVYYFYRHKPNFQRSKWKSFKTMWRRDSNRYALVMAVTASLGFSLAYQLNVERGYWVVGTILIVMMPDRYQGLYKSFQRLFGTLIGALLASSLMIMTENYLILIGLCTLAAFLAPYGLIKNYWLGNIFICGLILFLLDISMYQGRVQDFDLAILRLSDIAIGCLLGMLGTMAAFPGKRYKHRGMKAVHDSF
jgi:hypothetical protein